MASGAKPNCPVCEEPATRTETRYGVRYHHCGLWAWGNHPLADADTHEARRRAHEAFDPIWKNGLMGRTEAYRALAEELGIPAAECHMKRMDRETAAAVPAAASRIIKEPR